MELKGLIEGIAELKIKDSEDNKVLRVKQIIIKHYKNIKRAKNFLMEFSTDSEELKRTFEELEKDKITYFFALDSYYGNEYLKLYIVKIIQEEIIKKKKSNLKVIK
jgi:hypothetical protein